MDRSPMQFVVWYIQNGILPISQWSEQNRSFVKRLIPYDMEQSERERAGVGTQQVRRHPNLYLKLWIG
ncbi:hypothetical protein [Nostoc sp.]